MGVGARVSAALSGSEGELSKRDPVECYLLSGN